tara:strand:- start:3164 stop:4252 length:1089 start_codon:yes stop_codon:yes gene_type:complete
LFSPLGRRTGHTSLIRQFGPKLKKKGFEIEVIALCGVDDVKNNLKLTILQDEIHDSTWSIPKKFMWWFKISMYLIRFSVLNYKKLKKSKIVTLTAGASLVLPIFFKGVFIWENVAYFEKHKVIDFFRLLLLKILKAIIILPTRNEMQQLKKIPFNINLRFLRNPYTENIITKDSSSIEISYDVSNYKFMSAGWFEHRKGFDQLIHSIKLIKNDLDRNTKFHIFGDGVESKALKEQVKENKLENIVVFRGFPDGLHDQYHQFNAFILPSRLEGFPLVMIDALAAGLPIIAFDCPTGPREIIKSGYNGQLVENSNLDQLSKTILEFSKFNKDKSLIYLNNSKESVKEFGPDIVIDDFITTINYN